MDLYGEFEWRGMVYGATDGLKERFARPNITAYVGFDPTASSLHVGSLLPIMALARLQRFGHNPIAVIGGGTGLIGDPSGKATERQLLTPEHVEANVESLRVQLARFLDFESTTNAARLVNNADWLTKLSAVEFMRDVGKHFTVNYMLAKESVKRRVESEDGISYTEFSYLLLQAYDFLELHRQYHCTVQMGGSDQWGNITAGIELIRRVKEAGAARAYGLVLPLVTTATGTKFGKTEAGTIWLDAEMTPPYEFYQFWLNADDRDAVKYLKFFTFLEREEIEQLQAETQTHPSARAAQRKLAEQVTRAVHGEEGLAAATGGTQVFFSSSRRDRLTGAALREALGKVPSIDLPVSEFQAPGKPLIEVLSSSNVASSRSDAVRLIKSGGIYLNNERVTDEWLNLTDQDAIDGEFFAIRKGKKQNFIIRLIRDGQK